MYDGYSNFLVNRFRKLFGKNFEKVMESYSKQPKKAVRMNNLKIKTNDCLNRLKRKGFRFSKVPWADYVYFVEKEPTSLSATTEYLMGYFFIQDATSTLPAIELNPHSDEIVLDMAASPGGKTTHISQLMRNHGVIVAAEVNKERIKTLLYNLERMGVENVISIRTDATKIKELNLKFDKILLDAPCTADGTIGKNKRLKKELSQKLYDKYSKKQKELIRAAKEVLKPGGILVYSTCSTAPEENEIIVEYAVEKLGFKLLTLKNSRYFTQGMPIFFGEKHPNYLKKCGRILPYQYDTQGFFVAKLRL